MTEQNLRITKTTDIKENTDCERSVKHHSESDRRKQPGAHINEYDAEENIGDCERSIRKPTLQPSRCVNENVKGIIGDCERSTSNPPPHQRANSQLKVAKETGKNRDIGVSSSNKNKDEMVWNITKIKLNGKGGMCWLRNVAKENMILIN